MHTRMVAWYSIRTSQYTESIYVLLMLLPTSACAGGIVRYGYCLTPRGCLWTSWSHVLTHVGHALPMASSSLRWEGRDQPSAKHLRRMLPMYAVLLPALGATDAATSTALTVRSYVMEGLRCCVWRMEGPEVRTRWMAMPCTRDMREMRTTLSPYTLRGRLLP